MSELNDIELVINELKALIEDTVMAENEGSRRCLNSDDLNLMETWIELLKQANGVNSKLANCAIFDVSEAKRKFPHPHVIWRKAAEENAIDFEIWFNKVSGNSR